jgi:peptidoglycan/LPS O-acetylase OafA/YrhL
MKGTGAPGARNTALDGLRGYAAIAVVFYHSILGSDTSLIPGVLRPPIWTQHSGYGVLEKVALSLLNGELAVPVFFAISGIVLFRSLASLHRGAWLRTCWTFALRRFVRIWPVLAVALLGTMAMLAVASHVVLGVAAPSARALGENLLLSEYGVNGATWTLHSELAMVPPLLVCFFLARRFGRLAVLGCVAYALLAFRFNVLLGGDFVLSYALPFALGGAAVESGLLDGLYRSRFAAPLALLAAAGTVLTFVLLADGVRFVPEVGLVTVAVGWVSAAPGGAVRRMLEAPVSRFLGRISYSFYLWNVPVFTIMLFLVGLQHAKAHPLEIGLAIGAAATLVTIPFAYASERWLEQPCIALGRALTRRTRRGGPAPKAALAVDGAWPARGS